MKKIGFLINIIIFLFCFNVTVYADDQFISVGLTKYKNVSTINLNNKNITIGKVDGYNFSSDGILSTNSSYTIKPLNIYTIKTQNNFYNYNDALNFSSSFTDGFIYKDNSWYVLVGSFNNMLDATNFKNTQNIDGEIIKINDCVAVYENGKVKVTYKNNMAIKSDDNITIDNKSYRNVININSQNNLLTVTNILDIEQYLYGVVPSEMPASWHKEALKAQAVACRNYAHSNLGNHKSEGFDVCDTTHCQVYNGTLNEKQTTTDAINETKGIYAYYNNQIINAVYSSSSGGYTDDAENVWSNSVPYLKAVDDSQEEGGKQWTRTFTFDELSNIANIGTVTEVILENSPVTGRVMVLTLKGANGEKKLEKDEIRTFFSKTTGGSLDSKNFKMAQSVISSVDSTKMQNSFYITSKSGTNNVSQQDFFVTNKNGDISKLNNMFIINKDKKVSNVTTQNTSTNTTTANYVSKLTRNESNSVTFVGKGWGHGVGMSQYGANSLAKKGYTYDQILKHYYTGIEVR